MREYMYSAEESEISAVQDTLKNYVVPVQWLIETSFLFQHGGFIATLGSIILHGMCMARFYRIISDEPIKRFA
jgi:hypothetical protein